MDLNTLEPVLNDVSEDIKKLNTLSKQLSEKVELLEKRISSFDQRLDQIKVVPPAVDTGPIKNLVQEKMTAIENRIEAQPKNVIKKHQLLFFPEQDTKEYYRFFASQIMPYVIWFFVVYFLYCLGRQIIVKWPTHPSEATSGLNSRLPG